MFAALLHFYSRVASQRTVVVHSIWGYTPDLPDDVLLCSPGEFINAQAYVQTVKQNAPTPLTPDELARVMEAKGFSIPYDRLFVYSRKDFMDIRTRIASLHNWTQRFLVAIDFPPSAKGDFLTADLVLQRLSDVPEISAFLHRQAQRKQTPQHTPATPDARKQ